MSNLVTTGLIAALAHGLTQKLGCKVQVHRVETKYTIGKRKTKTQIRYTIAIEGSHPPMFFGMTINEAKSRMAMLSDLLVSGVIKSANTDAETLTRTDRSGNLPGVQDGTASSVVPGQDGCIQGVVPVDTQSPDDNDSY